MLARSIRKIHLTPNAIISEAPAEAVLRAGPSAQPRQPEDIASQVAEVRFFHQRGRLAGMVP